MNCSDCGQPMLPPGEEKRPNEYDHASGCPKASVSKRRLYVVANMTGTAWWMSREADGRIMWTKKQLYATTFSSRYSADRAAKKYGGVRVDYNPDAPCSTRVTSTNDKGPER